jgi:hypothetical protein
MLGDQTDVRGAGFELRSLGGSGGEGRSRDPVVADQERVVEVVDQGCDDDLVDRREGDRVDRGAGRLPRRRPTDVVRGRSLVAQGVTR